MQDPVREGLGGVLDEVVRRTDRLVVGPAACRHHGQAARQCLEVGEAELLRPLPGRTGCRREDRGGAHEVGDPPRVERSHELDAVAGVRGLRPYEGLERTSPGHAQARLGDLSTHDPHGLEDPVDALVLRQGGGEEHVRLLDGGRGGVEELGVHAGLDDPDQLLVEAVGEEVILGRVDHAQEQVGVAAGVERLPVGRHLVERLVREVLPRDDRLQGATRSGCASPPTPS